MEDWIIKIIDKGYKFTLDIYFYRKYGNKVEVLREGGIVESYEIGTAIEDKPLLSLSREALQSFADELSHIGIKPQKGFLEGKLEATENHLKDMRTLLKLK